MKPGKTSLRKAIREAGGNVSDVAAFFGVTRQTVYRWLDFYQMRGDISSARGSMREIAKDVIYARLMSVDEDRAYDAAKFVTLHLADDGNLLEISPETMLLLRKLGIKPDDVVRHLADIAQSAVDQSS